MKTAMLAPEYVIESSGIACGDRMTLYLYQSDGYLFFAFKGESCSIATKSAMYLESFSGLTKKRVFEVILRLEQGEVYFEEEEWIKQLSEVDKKCFLTPVIMLKTFFLENKLRIDEQTTRALECDACVSVQRLIDYNNSIKPKRIDIQTIKGLLIELKKNYDDEIDIQKMGLYNVIGEKANEVKSFLMNTNEITHKLIKKLRLPALYYNKAKKIGCELDSKIYAMATKQNLSSIITKREVTKIEDYMHNHHIRAYRVKGQSTDKYYPK